MREQKYNLKAILRRDHKSHMGSPCLSLSLFSCWYFPDHSHPLCATTLAWKVHVIIFSFHATYFHTLLTPLDFRYVNAQFDFQCVDSSATVGEYMYIYILFCNDHSHLYMKFSVWIHLEKTERCFKLSKRDMKHSCSQIQEQTHSCKYLN